MVDYVPQQGHFIRIRFDPQAGHEQMGNRPALVISHTAFNNTRGFAFVCPISNTKRQNPFYIVISDQQAIAGVIMTDQMRSLDYVARRAEFIRECPEALVQKVLSRIRRILF